MLPLKPTKMTEKSLFLPLIDTTMIPNAHIYDLNFELCCSKLTYFLPTPLCHSLKSLSAFKWQTFSLSPSLMGSTSMNCAASLFDSSG